MIGAIIGDIVGSRFEGNNYKRKDFQFFHRTCSVSDDSLMTLAVAKALLESRNDYSALGANCVKYMKEIGLKYPDYGFSFQFIAFLAKSNPKPYNSCGNGAAMRISAVPYCASSLEEVKLLSKLVTEVSHNHPEGIKGAEATAVCGWMAMNGKEKDEIRKYVEDNYYALDFTIDGIRESYKLDGTCQNTVPQAIEAFLESESFEDAIRTAISLGGDSDTIAAICGGIAEPYYGVPLSMRSTAKQAYLDKYLLAILEKFEAVYPAKTIDG